MQRARYAIATAELLLIFPAVLFMTALFVRNVQPLEYEPAHSAQQIVIWYAHRPYLGLWVLLGALPFIVLLSGCAVIWQRWRYEIELRQELRRAVTALTPHIATLLIAIATLAAGAVLAIVALHVATD